MNGNYITVIGMLAATCTTLSFVPQVVKTIKSKRTQDISVMMYTILTIGLFLWLIYGLLIGDLPLIIANLISFSLSALVLIMKIKHG